MATILIVLADRRGLSHFLRSNHTNAAEITTRSRRTSRSTTSDRMHSVEHTYAAGYKHDTLEDVEHKRVIDNFVVSRGLENYTKATWVYTVGFPVSSQHATRSISASRRQRAGGCHSGTLRTIS
jgi:hypothetical protein